MLRPDKQARAALNNFDVWYSQQWSQSPLLTFPIANSTVTLFRRAAPHSMLYFLIQVLHRMLHQFWPTALSDSYVKQCRISNGRCPPSIIALLFYFECRDLSPCMRVAIPATNKQRLYDSETARAAARLSQSAGSATAASSGVAAPARDRGEAFWQTFAEKVMQHLVWPAVRAGVIRVAPAALKDNPEWWTEGILPILNHPEVASLHWVGGNHMARQSWWHVCEVLRPYEFPGVFFPESFAQRTVLEFLEVAGYREVLLSEDVASTDPPTAKRRRASSNVPSGAASLTAQISAAPALPCQSKLELARAQADHVRRQVYSELDEHARETIASAEYRFLSHPRDCRMMARAFRTYQSTRQYSWEPLDPKAVVAELRFTVDYFSEMNLWPCWVLRPNGRDVQPLQALRPNVSVPEPDVAYEDCGNEIWEALVHLTNLASAIPSVYGVSNLNAHASTVHGDGAKKFGEGIYNYRSNVVERLLAHLLRAREEEPRDLDSSAVPV